MDVHHQRLQSAIEWIEQNPGSHDQEVWIQSEVRAVPGDWSTNWCGTTCCLAGFGVIAAGYKPIFHKAMHGGYIADEVAVADGGIEDIRDAAAEWFGLNDVEADALFDGSNGIEDLWDFAEEFTDGAVRRPKGTR